MITVSFVLQLNTAKQEGFLVIKSAERSISSLLFSVTEIYSNTDPNTS